jgi:CopG family nickel-responsive transcriptional regulator
MSQLERFGVSMEGDLLDAFDRLLARRGYSNRSEALRDMVRKELIAEEWSTSDGPEAVGTLTLVYDHHKRELTDKIVDLGHDHMGMVLASMHIHLDHDHCLEVTALKGARALLQEYANQLIGLKGVIHGRFVPTSTGTLRS